MLRVKSSNIMFQINSSAFSEMPLLDYVFCYDTKKLREYITDPKYQVNQSCPKYFSMKTPSIPFFQELCAENIIKYPTFL